MTKTQNSVKERVTAPVTPHLVEMVDPKLEIDSIIEKTRKAQNLYAHFTQEQVDHIVHQAAMAANQARIPLARSAREETGMGILEDKVIKNHFAAEFVSNRFRETRTCGVIEDDHSNGFVRVAEPLGIIAGIVPTTNPTSTAIFKALMALKTRNGIIFSPHPRAKKCTVETAKLILDAAVKAGAPKDIIGWIEEPTLDKSQCLMAHPEINLILATGGPGMVKAAYSSGKPAIGVGSGNTPAVIDETADIKMAVSSILLSKSFDNGLICASEQSVVVCDEIYKQVCSEFVRQGAYILDSAQKEQLGRFLVQNGKLNTDVVGQSPSEIAKMVGFEVPEETRVLIGEVSEVGTSEAFSYEKLSPILGIYRVRDFEEALGKAASLVEFGGLGHTSVLYTDPSCDDRAKAFREKLKTGRILLNMPSSQGAIGDIYNFRLEPSLTLGCGSWGGNSVSENVGPKHLLNIKTVAARRANMLWFRVPPKIFFKSGCLEEALRDLEGRKRVMIVTDRPLFELGYPDKVTPILERMGMDYQIFFDVKPDPDLETVRRGLALMNSFQPDVILALGGGSPMDAAKIMWLLYENPEVHFEDLAMRFMDIRKRICRFPSMGKKAIMVAIPTSSGTGSEVTPFAVITDEVQGVKYPIADYELTPDMAIVDPDLVMTMPKGLTASSGIDAVSHALEALAAVTATDYTHGIALEALELLFKHLPASYRDGNRVDREKVHYASTLAGMAFANAFLGLCHSMAHKLGSAFHVPHGVANGIILPLVIRYNQTPSPRKMAAFSQYAFPSAMERYAEAADRLKLGGKNKEEKVEKLISAVEKLRAELELPATIKEAGVREKDFMASLDDLSEKAFDDQCTGANPRYPLISEIKELYLEAWGK